MIKLMLFMKLQQIFCKLERLFDTLFMKSILKKLLLGNVSKFEKPDCNPLQKRIKNIKAIWNNDHQDDNGIEKIVRLFLSSSQLLFPGVYIKYLINLKGYVYRDLALDFYVLLKVSFPLFILSLVYMSVSFSQFKLLK